MDDGVIGVVPGYTQSGIWPRKRISKFKWKGRRNIPFTVAGPWVPPMAEDRDA